MNVDALKDFVMSWKLWLTIVTAAFTLGGALSVFNHDQATHAETTNEILTITKSHTADVKEILTQVKEELVTSRKLNERLVKINTKMCQHAAKTEASRDDCLE